VHYALWRTTCLMAANLCKLAIEKFTDGLLKAG